MTNRGRIGSRSVKAIVGLMLCASGCAAMAGWAARKQYIVNQTQNYTYGRPIQAAWPEVRTMFFEQGIEIENTGEASTFTLETKWKYTNDARDKWLIQGLSVTDQTSQVHLTKVHAVGNSQSSNRDYDMEWRLIQRLEPDKAAQITSDAEQAGAAAKAAKEAEKSN